MLFVLKCLFLKFFVFFFKQKTAYEIVSGDWSSDVCSNDIAERALWPRYMAVYQDIVRHTSTAAAPWYVVPADHKWFARLVSGSVIVSTLEALDLQFPRADPASLHEFKKVREALESEGKTKRNKAKNKKQP